MAIAKAVFPRVETTVRVHHNPNRAAPKMRPTLQASHCRLPHGNAAAPARRARVAAVRVRVASTSADVADVGAEGHGRLLLALSEAVARRKEAGLMIRADTEGTNAFRLLHGPTEGFPGLTMDLYGDRVLVQSWRDALDEEAREALSGELRALMPGVVDDVVFHLRGRAARNAGKPLHQRQRRQPDEEEVRDDEAGESHMSCTFSSVWPVRDVTGLGLPSM